MNKMRAVRLLVLICLEGGLGSLSVGCVSSEPTDLGRIDRTDVGASDVGVDPDTTPSDTGNNDVGGGNQDTGGHQDTGDEQPDTDLPDVNEDTGPGSDDCPDLVIPNPG